MSEFATRKSDGHRIKIGTCQNLYYLRYDQRDEVYYDRPFTDMCFRLPLPDEDKHKPGEFEFEGSLKNWHTRLNDDFLIDMKDEPCFQRGGVAQVKMDELGVILSVPCYHGFKLPTGKDCEVRSVYNGKINPMRILYIKPHHDGRMRIGVTCKSCGSMWEYTFDEIDKYLISHEMRSRLFKFCQEYRHEKRED